MLLCPASDTMVMSVPAGHVDDKNMVSASFVWAWGGFGFIGYRKVILSYCEQFFKPQGGLEDGFGTVYPRST